MKNITDKKAKRTCRLDDGAISVGQLVNRRNRSSLKHNSTKFNYRDWHVSFADYLARTHYFFLIPKQLRDIKRPIQHFISLNNQ